MNRYLLIIVLLLSGIFLSAQQPDSLIMIADSAAHQKAVKKAIYSRARKAAVMSAILPGLGQGYNGKYWKIPVIYAGLGTLTYFFVQNQKDFVEYQNYLRAESDDDTSTDNPTDYSQEQLLAQKKYYQKYRDLSAIGIVVIYLFNIVDANVDAHLKSFDVSDDLSMRIDPWQQPVYGNGGIRMATGISLKFNFK